MTKLVTTSGKEMCKLLEKLGFEKMYGRGSHVIMIKQTANEKIPLVVPMHKEIDTGTLLEIIRQSKMTRDDFLKLL